MNLNEKKCPKCRKVKDIEEFTNMYNKESILCDWCRKLVRDSSRRRETWKNRNKNVKWNNEVEEDGESWVKDREENVKDIKYWDCYPNTWASITNYG